EGPLAIEVRMNPPRYQPNALRSRTFGLSDPQPRRPALGPLVRGRRHPPRREALAVPGRLQRTGSRPLPLAPAARDPGAGRRGGPLPLPSRRRAARRDPRGGRPPPRRAGPATRRGAGAGCGAGASPPRRCALRGATPPLLALFPPAL